MDRRAYARLTIEGDKETVWLCGCFLTEDGYFKFCLRHNESLKKAVLAQIDELDMTAAAVADGRAKAAQSLDGGGGGRAQGRHQE